MSMGGLLETRINVEKLPDIKLKWGPEWGQVDNYIHYYKCRILIFINKRYWNWLVYSSTKQHITLLLHNKGGA